MSSGIDLRFEQFAKQLNMSTDSLIQSLINPSSLAPPLSGQWSGPVFGGIGNATLALNEARAIPWDLTRPLNIVALAAGVTTLSATGLLRLGIFLDDGSGNSPGALITDFGTVVESAAVDNLQTGAGTTGLLQPQRVWLVGRQETTGGVAAVRSGNSPIAIWGALNTASQNFGLASTGAANAFSTGWPLGGTPGPAASTVLIRAKAA